MVDFNLPSSLRRKKTTIRQEKKVMLADAELIEKYGTGKPTLCRVGVRTGNHK